MVQCLITASNLSSSSSPSPSFSFVMLLMSSLNVFEKNYLFPRQHSSCQHFVLLVHFSAAAPRIWYASLFTKPRCGYQPSRANSKIIYKVGNWHASSPPPLLPRETAAAGPSFLAGATASGWPGYSLQGTPRCEPPPKERVGIFGEGCEILE